MLLCEDTLRSRVGGNHCMVAIDIFWTKREVKAGVGELCSPEVELPM